MSFSVDPESGEVRRQTFNPEDVTEGKPRVLKFRMRKTGKGGHSQAEAEGGEELEVDRELPQFTNLPPFEEKDADKQLLLNILGDLSSETFVLLGPSRLDEKAVEEQIQKNKEWESWKEEHSWSPKPQRKPRHNSDHSSTSSPFKTKKRGSPKSTPGKVSSKSKRRASTSKIPKEKLLLLSPRKNKTKV